MANIDIPDSVFSGDFDALGSDELFSDVPKPPPIPTPMSPRTLAERENVVRECTELCRQEFPRGCHLDHVSYFSNRSIGSDKLGSWVDLSGGVPLPFAGFRGSSNDT